MIIFDFLIYNLTNWYTEHTSQSNWSTALERAVYAVGICITIWLLDIWIMINIFLFKKEPVLGSTIPFIIVGLVITKLGDYIYENKGRLERIRQASIKPLNIDGKPGQFVSIGLTLLPMIVFVILLITT